MDIRSTSSSYEFGKSIDELVTYRVNSTAAEPLVEVLDVFPLPNRCHHVVCGQDSKSVAFVQQLVTDGFGASQVGKTACFGIWLHAKLQQAPPPCRQCKFADHT